MAKYVPTCLAFMFLVIGAGILPVSGGTSLDGNVLAPNAGALVEDLSREYPIAAGIWYPTDGPLPEKPVRYYRIRCWPGCHTGSSYGKYPHKALKDKPIWPTSTVDMPSTARPDASQKNP
ncbi:MAG: hypothetical protein JSW39_22420 [Desulfobacterales bacterium]|nr:MAG: hypothetical protein JSW39_22420 [Desulfobacterales bacterium]